MSKPLQLPYPPSANRIWRNVNGKVLKSAFYRAWLAEAAVAILRQRPTKLKGRYSLSITAHRPDNRARDLDNLLKPLSDALAAAGVIPNDSMAETITIRWSPDGVVPGGRIDVEAQPA